MRKRKKGSNLGHVTPDMLSVMETSMQRMARRKFSLEMEGKGNEIAQRGVKLMTMGISTIAELSQNLGAYCTCIKPRRTKTQDFCICAKSWSAVTAEAKRRMGKNY